MSRVTTFVAGVDDFLDVEEGLWAVVLLPTLLLVHSEVVEELEVEAHTGVVQQCFIHTIDFINNTLKKVHITNNRFSFFILFVEHHLFCGIKISDHLFVTQWHSFTLASKSIKLNHIASCIHSS
jgi:hypothetical protein